MTEAKLMKVGSVLAASVALLWPLAMSAAEAPEGELPFGVYDPEGQFADAEGVTIEHLFLPWEDIYLPSLVDADNYAVERGRSVLVTIEPWTWNRSERNTPDALKKGLSSGNYDKYMSAICAILDVFNAPVTLRWAQEMEDHSGQFIWAAWPPEEYIAAYRRMVGTCRAQAPRVAFMWSPLGFDDLGAYYPGDDVVDIVGISVFGFEPWEKAVLGKAQSFTDIVAPRYASAAAFGKPVAIAEVGYSGSVEYVAEWDEELRKARPEYPALVAVSYFNQKEVYPWPDGFGMPDWRFGRRVLD